MTIPLHPRYGEVEEGPLLRGTISLRGRSGDLLGAPLGWKRDIRSYVMRSSPLLDVQMNSMQYLREESMVVFLG